MPEAIDPLEALKVFEALESGRLDHLFTAANIDYYDREGFEALRFSAGISKDAVWRLISAIRKSTGILVFESAWGEFEVRVTPTAQLMKALYEIDTWRDRSLFGKTDLPPDEEWIVEDRLLMEESILITLDKTLADDHPQDELDSVRAAVIRALYEETTPSTEAELIATRFYRVMRMLPDMCDVPITADYIAGIHRLLREGEPDAGVLRTAEAGTQRELGLPGPQRPARIEGEMRALCAYAQSQDIPFIHPLIKALAIAWWLRRIQPFNEYNYLVSRLVSMGYALRHGYHLIGIADASLRLRTQGDHVGDQTADFIGQLNVIRDAKILAEDELLHRAKRYRELLARFESLGLNHRQAFILDRAIRKPTTPFTIKHHARTRKLAYETARQDFLRLVERGLLEQYKKGRAFEFRLAPGAAETLMSEGAG